MRKRYLILVGAIFVHLFILSRLQFTAWPEMVSFPYLVNHGFVTYRDAIHAYPALLINILAILYKIFGYNVWVLKIFGWFGFFVSDILIFVLIQKFTKNKNLAIIGVLGYAILQPVLEGNMVWPDLVIVPFLLLTFLFLSEKRYFWSGIMIGLAILTKQTGIFFLGISILWLFIYERNLKTILRFGCGILIVVLPFILVLLKQNSFMEFVNWAIIYPSKYWTKFPGYVQLTPTLRENLILLTLFFPFAFLIFKAKKKIFADKYFLLLFGFLICGLVGIYPRFSFFHFQSALAFLIIIIGYLINNTKIKPHWFLIPVLFILIFQHNQLMLVGNRFWSEGDLVLAEKIKNESVPDKPVYLLGLPSGMYAYADRLPNKPWLDNFGWYLEINGVQEEVIRGFEKEPPDVIFWETPINGNWYDIGVYQPKMITDWIRENYVKKGEIQEGVGEWVRK